MQGCVVGHTVIITDRGGATKIAQLVDISQVTWGRKRDGKSLATVTIAGQACREQTATINAIQARRHEMVVFRGDERVWEGPVRTVTTYRDTAVIVAADVIEYLDFTALSVDWPLETGTPVGGASALMTERIETILTHELTVPYEMTVGTGGAAQEVTVPRWEGIDAPANVLPHLEVRHSETLLTRSDTLAFEMMLGEHLYNLGRGGLDYTAVGRKLLVWDSAESIGRTRTVTDADFSGDIEVVMSGGDHWSISHVSGQRQEEEPDEEEPAPEVPSVGNAGAEHPYYGVWTNVLSLSSEEGSEDPTQDELNSQAQRDLVGRTPVPILLNVPQGSSLRLSHDLTINDLVPGVEVPVRATLNLRALAQTQRLDALEVTETAAGEQVAVSLIPLGEVVEL